MWLSSMAFLDLNVEMLYMMQFNFISKKSLIAIVLNGETCVNKTNNYSVMHTWPGINK